MGQRLIIAEEEKNRILNLHGTSNNRNYLFEDPNDVLGNQETPVVGATPSGPTLASTMSQPELPAENKPADKSSKVLGIQNNLNSKLNSGLKTDGKWGPKTATAVLNALKTTSSTPKQAEVTKPIEEPIEKMPIGPITPITRTNTQLAPGQPMTTK